MEKCVVSLRLLLLLELEIVKHLYGAFRTCAHVEMCSVAPFVTGSSQVWGGKHRYDRYDQQCNHSHLSLNSLQKFGFVLFEFLLRGSDSFHPIECSPFEFF